MTQQNIAMVMLMQNHGADQGPVTSSYCSEAVAQTCSYPIPCYLYHMCQSGNGKAAASLDSSPKQIHTFTNLP